MKTNALTLRLMAAHCVIKNYFTGNEFKITVKQIVLSMKTQKLLKQPQKSHGRRK